MHPLRNSSKVASLVTLLVIATVFTVLVALFISGLGSASPLLILALSIPIMIFFCLFALVGIVCLFLVLIDVVHHYREKWGPRNNDLE